MKGIYLVATLYVVTLGVVALNKSSVTGIPKSCSDAPRNETVLLPHESDCTKYYNCYMGVKGKPLDCPLMDNNGNRLHFNPVLQVCDWPWSAGCQLSSTSSSSFPTQPTPPSTSSTPFTTPSSTSSSPTPSPTSPTSSSSSPTPSTTLSSSSPTPSTTLSSSSPTPSTTLSSSSPTPSTTLSSSSPTPSTTLSSSSPTPSTTLSSSSSTPSTTLSSNSPTSSTTSSSSSPTSSTTLLPTPSISSTTTESTSLLTTPSSLTCKSDGRIHMIPHETMCDNYYTCFNGYVTPIPKKCDRDLLFNPVLRVCDYPENVDCSATGTIPRSMVTVLPTTPSSKIITSTILPTSPSSSPILPKITENIVSPTPSSLTCKSDDRIHMIPHETMCDNYYTCFNGYVTPIPKKCKRHLLFNPILRVCDYPENVDCSATGTIPRSTVIVSPTPSSLTCKSDDRIHMIPHETMCDNYYTCFNGYVTPIPKKCERHLLFNPNLRVCDYPENVDCSATGTIPRSTVIVSPTPSSWTCMSDNRHHKIPHQIMCDSYYTCFNGEVNPVPIKCERHLLFNPMLRVCDYPENVDCNDIRWKSINVPSTTPSIITTSILPLPIRVPTPPTSPLFPPTPNPYAWICEPNGKTYKVPHKTMCDYFYWCVDGKISRNPTKCPNDLLFNPVSGQCDFSENVDCINRTTPTTTTTKTTDTTTPTTITTTSKKPTITTTDTTTPTTITTTSTTTSKEPTTTTTVTPTTTTETPKKPREKCPPKGSTEKARIAHKCVCNLYYECIDGEKVPQTCPIGMHFDYVREVCDWAAVVKCIRPIPISSLISKCCAPEGRRFQHESDCSLYYLCDNYEKILQRCIAGRHFNVTRQICDYPQNTNCGLNIKSNPTIIANSCPPPGSTEKVLLPHQCVCSKYYECINGRKALRVCEDGLLFDSIRLICTDPDEAICGGDLSTTITIPETTPTTITEITTKAPEKPRKKCPPKGSTEIARIAHNCICNMYYECIDGEKVLQTCPIGMHFDEINEFCDWAANVKCIRPIPTYNTLIGNYDTKCSSEGKTFQHETSCTAYYLCYNGEKILKHCIAGLHFNAILQMCDYPQKTDCDLIDKSLPITASDICPFAGSMEKVLLPHECQCTQYYECINGKQVLRDCPDGLHYDRIQQTCNEPAKAECVNFIFAPTVPTEKSYQDSDFMVKKIEKRDSVAPLSNVNNNGRDTNDNFLSKLQAYNDLSTCIGTCPEEDLEFAIFLPNEDCKKFCMCSDGFAWVQSCPDSLYFDSVEKICKGKRDAACAVRSFSQNDASTVDVSDENGSMQVRKKMNKNKREINKYFWYQPHSRKYDPSYCIGTCPEENFEYPTILSHVDCKKYCTCSSGLPYVQLCFEPFYFDSVHKICKHKKYAVCAKGSISQHHVFTIDRIIDEKTDKFLTESNGEGEIYNYWPKRYFYNLDPSYCIGTCPDDNVENTVFLPHKDCKKYCLCSKNLPYVQPCFEPFYYDSVHQICKHKKHVVCAERTIDQHYSFTIDETIEEDDSMQFISEYNNNKQEIYD